MDLLKIYADAITGGGGIDPIPGVEEDLPTKVINIINVVVGVLGIVAVIVVVMGGMTSAGNPEKVKKAKNTILYGVIGLIICALAFAIVNFVIKNIIGAA